MRSAISKSGDNSSLAGRVEKVWSTLHGHEHPQVALLLSNMGVVLEALGDREGAARSYKEAVKISIKCLGPKAPQTKTYMAQLHDLRR